MILTSEHQINVIGKSLINDTNILCENSTLQYTSPPGNTTSFLYSNEDITHNDIPKISISFYKVSLY